MKIAVEGCAHGELDNIYNTIKCLEKKENFKVDLLICCGDFQSSRNYDDLCCMAMPPKYYNICSFYKYYNGEKVAPVLTIFIGGNHEASNYLQELPYGGWVAPNIYYLGYAGVINIGGIRIGGISGIFKSRDYMKGHYEYSPYDDNTKRSVYHIRNLEIFRLKQLSGPLNIFLSHDWPQGVTDYGNKAQLVRYKPYFEEDINNGALGSVPLKDLLNKLKPEYWFAAHLHCKFAAIIPHDDGKKTKFLALDKCLPTKRFLQIIDIPHNIDSKIEINYDLEWLTILRTTNHLLSVKNVNNYLPGPGSQEKWSFTPTEEEKSITLSKFGNNLVVPNNFKKTAKGVMQNTPKNVKQPMAMCNSQTVLFCQKLSVDDPLNLILNLHTEITETSFDSNTDESDVSVTNPLQRKITALSLPEPERDDVNLPLIEENCEDTPKLWEIDQTEAEMSNSDVVENVSNKFKRRRNAALYSFNS